MRVVHWPLIALVAGMPAWPETAAAFDQAAAAAPALVPAAAPGPAFALASAPGPAFALASAPGPAFALVSTPGPAPTLVSAADAAPATSAASAPPTAAGPLPGLATPLKNASGCLATRNGFLRAKIRGALTLDLDLHDSELECDGGPRPDGSGIRVSFAGPVRSDGRRLRMVFGVASAAEGTTGKALPTNLTVIFEGEQRMFATRGDDKCTADRLSQERVGALGGPLRTYRVIASGFCIAPVNALNDQEKILVSSFDFAGSVTFEDPGRDEAAPSGSR